MQQLTQQFPDDLDARTLYAESLMDLRPWGYFTRDGQPHEETEARAARARVRDRSPPAPPRRAAPLDSPVGVDRSERAEAEADRLVPLMPGAGHMVHMPAHIYQRVGRHADVIHVNLMAAKADEDYIAQCRAQGIYPLAYYPHNLHFIWMGASANGQKTLAFESARKLAAAVPREALGVRADPPGLPGGAVFRDGALQRLGRDSGGAEARARVALSPAASGATPAHWRWSTAASVEDAERELTNCGRSSLDPSLKGQTTFSANSGTAIVQIAPEIVAGEIALKRGDVDRAIAHFDRAVRYEDALVYQEPPDWHVPGTAEPRDRTAGGESRRPKPRRCCGKT